MNASMRAQFIKDYEEGKLQDSLYDSNNLEKPTVIVGIYDDHVLGYEQVDGAKDFFVAEVVGTDEGKTFVVNKTVYNLKTFVEDKTHWGLRFTKLWGNPSKVSNQ